MPTIGTGVHEIRIRDEAGTLRLMYVAKFPEAIYVLHAFQKKTRATSTIYYAAPKEAASQPTGSVAFRKGVSGVV